MNYAHEIFVNERKISLNSPTYFIADIAANHDGDLQRAKDLIWLAKQSGADAAKFQHFKAKNIVSDYGFKSLGGQQSHQASWKKSVYEIYQQYECDRSWSEELNKTAKEANIDFLTAPYDFEAIELLDQYLPAYKIGSGDITWHSILEVIALKGKPVFLATGASTMHDVEAAVATILKHNNQLLLMQCNTNYTGRAENFKYVNLRVLQTFSAIYPGMLLGLSDHTPGYAAVLGAIVFGARAIEKHFTDDTKRVGPDHSFSLNPIMWREMVDRSRELEAALGDGIKRIEENERETVILQRRCVRLSRSVPVGHSITCNDIECLRPAPIGAIEPYRINDVIGKVVVEEKREGDALFVKDIKDGAC
jgi:N-acetylneuraminate synthase